MPWSRRAFRVFVSSTFADFGFERDALQRHVFPRLRDLCRRHDVRFLPIDLRWGVSEEAVRDHRTLTVCLEEVERCRQVSPDLNFVLLLGHRMGSQPLLPSIPAEDFEQFPAQIRQELGKWWYRRDDNAVPAAYHLRPRPTGDDTQWAPIEAGLQGLLRRAAEVLPPERRHLYLASTTELEVRHRDLAKPGNATGAYAYFRSTKDLDADRAATERLDTLKQDVRNALGEERVTEYATTWGDGGVDTSYVGELPTDLDRCLALIGDPQRPRTLCADMFCQLAEAMSNALEGTDTTDRSQREGAAHLAFASERAASFVGRSASREAIHRYLRGPPGHLFVLVGAPGAGKSAVLARAAQEIRSEHPGAAVVERYVGATPASADPFSLLADLCDAISRAYQVTTAVPDNYADLVAAFPERLRLATDDRPLYLVLDAVDQLARAEGAPLLTWLPAALPDAARIVVSTSPGDALHALRRKRPAAELHELEPMPRAEASVLLDRWLADAGRALQDEQREVVLTGFDAQGQPLYLALAFEEARRWPSYGPPVDLGADVATLVRDNLFDRLGDPREHGPVLVDRALAYLAASRDGLSEDEILDVLGLDPDVSAYVSHHSIQPPVGGALPSALWARLFHDLEPYLTERETERGTLLGFYHRQLAEVASSSYLPSAVAPTRHSRLADFFGGRGSSRLRQLAELPHHLSRAGRWSDVASTLTDLDFIHRKSAEGMVYGLLEDYQDAVTGMPEGDPRALVASFSSAVSQEHNVFLTDARGAAQQVYANLFGRTGFDGPVGALLRGLTAYPDGGSWLRRTSSGRASDPSPALLSTLRAHTDSVTAVAVSPTGDLIGSGGTDGVVRIWDAQRRIPLATFEAHGGGVVALAWRDDDRLVSAGRDAAVREWDWLAAQRTDEWSAPARVRDLIVTGERVLCAGDDWLVHTLGPAGHQALRGHADRVLCLASSRSRGVVVSGSDDATLRAWDPSGGVLALRHAAAVRCVAVEPGGAWAVSGDGDRNVHVWDIVQGSRLRTLSRHHQQPLTALRVLHHRSPGDDSVEPLVASTSRDGTIKLWDPETTRERAVLRGHTSAVTALDAPDEGEWLVSGGDDGTVRIWSTGVGDRSGDTDGWPEGRLTCLACDPSGDRLVSGHDDGTIVVWSSSGEVAATLRGHLDGVTWVACLRSDRIVSVARDHLVKLWDPSIGWSVGTVGGARAVQAAVVDDHTIITVGHDRAVRVWDVDARAEGRLVGSSRSLVDRISYTPRRDLVATAGKGATIDVWPVRVSGDPCRLPGHGGGTTSLVFDPGGCLLSAGRDGEVRRWDPDLVSATWHPVSHVDSWVTCLAVSATGEIVASGARDGSLTLAVGGGPAVTWPAHASSVRGVFFDADEWLYSWGDDRRLMAWQPRHGVRVADLTLGAPISAVVCLGARRVAVGSRWGGLTVVELVP